MKHGTVTGYNRHKCRCDGCKAARAAYDADYRARKRVARKSAKPRRRVHGTLNEYNNHRCRCPLCKAARAAYDKQYSIDTNRAAHRRKRRARLRASGDWRTQP